MKILIIEDDLSIRNTLQDLLEVHGHTVLTAPDGDEGVKLAKYGPDLILCDVAMPRMGGFQVIAAVRELPQGRDIPFIFLTAKTDREDQRLGMSLGADDYISKPFTERDIIAAIAARIRRLRPLRERIEELLAERRSTVDADWSHELMTPLCGVMGGLELIEAEADTIQPGELRKLLGLIRSGANRQHDLSKKLVLFYELERLKAAPPRRACLCHDTAIAAGAAQAAMAENRSDDLIIRCDAGSLPVPEAHLIAAVAELVGNACRFSRKGQPVRVTGSRDGSRYEIEIIDQGPGMTAEQRTSVGAFKQFGRKEQEQQGLGLGLIIARSVAELGGGRFNLEAGPGSRGLTAVIDLPAVGGEAPP